MENISFSAFICLLLEPVFRCRNANKVISTMQINYKPVIKHCEIGYVDIDGHSIRCGETLSFEGDVYTVTWIEEIDDFFPLESDELKTYHTWGIVPKSVRKGWGRKDLYSLEDLLVTPDKYRWCHVIKHIVAERH